MTIHPLRSLPVTALALLLAAAAPQASASGFQLRDQSGSGQGNAYAGISAGGSDISSMFFNPATLTRFEGNRLQIGITEIMPSSKLSGGSASRTGIPGPISGAASTGNIASSATLPTFYSMWSASPDLKFGLSVNVPFGLTTTYDANWAGRYQAVKSHLETLDITPTVAYRMGKEWSIGGSFVARRAKAELSQALDLGYATAGYLGGLQTKDPNGNPVTVNNPGIVAPGQEDGFVDVQGSGWAYGYKLGLLYEPSDTLHFGLGYQSAIKETVKGSATFNTSALQAQIPALEAAQPNQYSLGLLNGALGALVPQTANGAASATVRLPSTISLGASYDVSKTLSLAAEISDTKWSGFRELRVRFSNPGAQPDSYTTENWKDALFVAVGATYHSDSAWTYRAGLALDKSPVPDNTRTARIPDADRTWLSGGVSYQFNKSFGVDAGYSHLFCKNSTIDQKAASDSTNPQAPLRGSLSGTYKNSIDILSVQARLSF